MQQPVLSQETNRSESRLAAFREGFVAPWEGFLYLCRHPALLRYSVLPLVLNLLITAVVLTLMVVTVIFVARQLHPRFPEGGGWVVLEILVGLALLVVALGIAVATWVLLQGALCGYFYAQLAQQVELQLGMRPEDIKEVALARQFADALRDFAVLAAINVGCLLVQIIPVVGSIIGLSVGLYFNCYILGMDYFDHPLALRGQHREEKRAFARRHRMQTLGLGAVVLLCNFVPVLGSVLLTTAVVGAVLLHRRLEPAA